MPVHTHDLLTASRETHGSRARILAWIGASVVLFVLLLLATLLAASRVTAELGIGQPEREHFAAVQALLFGGSLLVAVPAVGRLLGEARSGWPEVRTLLPLLLAAAASYVLVEDVRSGHLFETDHALPEIFVPPAIALLASAYIGRAVSATAAGRRGWSWFGAAAALVLLMVVASVGMKMIRGSGGMFQLDSSPTVLVLAGSAAYAIIALHHGLFRGR